MIEIDVETSHWVSNPANPNDEWDRDDTDGRIDGVAAYYVTEGDSTGYRGMGWGDHTYDVDAQPGDVVHVVIAEYSTGDTFGRSGGQVSVMDVFTENHDAVELWKFLSKVKDEFSVKHNGQDYYIPWNGYFESLEDLDIRTLVVQNGVNR